MILFRFKYRYLRKSTIKIGDMRYLDLKNAHRLLFSAQSRWFSFDISLNPNW